LGLNNARLGLGFLLQAWAFAGLAAYVEKNWLWLGVWPAEFTQNPGSCGLGLLVYVVKA
jgi:hypothetical protein